MKTITRRAATVVTAGALTLGGPTVAAPALAGHGPFGGFAPTGTATADRGPGYGMGMGYGACPGSSLTAEQGTLDDAQKAALTALAQKEKLAHDLYAAFAARYDAPIFDHIAMAETHHLDAVRTLLRRYGVTDPTADQKAGTFTDPAVQADHDKLLAEGGKSLSAALAAAQQSERDDIAALRSALDGLSAPDAEQVYTRLLTASERHLAAFTRWSTR
ncbi:hypothetical protein FHR83_009226 [Actinoplanes campanulatus]|uniref:DUF2202 domain-containing protein n=1 Tax=Actinoplanes campanulatus TaxID=113559 RepID=A0A7W5ASN8_9ACTN|nr:DUF2202 domain-containing protein [Actinoplanes campanulatus]MBB3101497.1 hypothetical protein [Actinoplanes campanulatus]GGN50577.1 hypothetical protein GCM10010109_89850 [Actinoplanes campanulatus]GID42092.1 hypothetical protein Aca09nite_85980 [Actinoplanes campanulatus]